ncbi:MAG TPA: carboxypeptidase-like regulatory domain-containing protein [Chthoniobacterales bacterium]|nr:carboxypeptidase-like regulatory domain-containing protein [Chthoniobacterales bacterium]
MKTLPRNLLLSLLVVAASAVYAAGTPAIDVTVSNSSGKLVYKGKTGANGTFATGKLEPGEYVVQFNAKKSAVQGDRYALVVSAGKKKVSADAVAGDKFAKGGVAMKVEVGHGLNITGQVAAGDAAVLASTGGAKVKVMNGKRYVWLAAETGSHMGGRWVEEGSAAASNVVRMSNSGVHAIQEHNDWRGQGGN